MVTTASGIRTFACAVSAAPARMSAAVLGVLRDATIGNLFWTMILTGSIGMAVYVIIISYANHIARSLISHLT